MPTDPSKLEEVFTQLLDVISARMKMLGLNLVFILIDNVDLLVVRWYKLYRMQLIPENVIGAVKC